jgi:hypothetical protein
VLLSHACWQLGEATFIGGRTIHNNIATSTERRTSAAPMALNKACKKEKGPIGPFVF